MASLRKNATKKQGLFTKTQGGRTDKVKAQDTGKSFGRGSAKKHPQPRLLGTKKK